MQVNSTIGSSRRGALICFHFVPIDALDRKMQFINIPEDPSYSVLSSHLYIPDYSL